MRVLVAGLGSIGRRHIRVLRDIDSSIEIAVWRHQSAQEGLGDLSSIVSKVFFTEEAALAWEPQAVFITNPSSRHLSTALPFLQKGTPLFIEKPLASSLEELRDFQNVFDQHPVPLLVGYNLRFYEPLRVLRSALTAGRIGRPLNLQAHVGQYLPDWRPAQDYRKGVTARKDLGGGVLLELSHEIDYARWLMGEITAVSGMSGRLGDLEVDVEDSADILLKFKSGAIGHIHMDMIDRAKTRWCRILGTEGTLTWDLLTHEVCLFTSKDSLWEPLYAKAPDPDESYRDEQKHFFRCVRGEDVPLVSLADGARVLEIVSMVRMAFLRIEEVTL
jgi:predicted dehydrogenase